MFLIVYLILSGLACESKLGPKLDPMLGLAQPKPKKIEPDLVGLSGPGFV